MLKLFTLFIFPLMLFSEPAMKCAPGKCAADLSSMKKEIPKKEENTSQMKCAPGKCASGDMDRSKDIPQRPQQSTTMKYEAGKCAQGTSKMTKNIPKKSVNNDHEKSTIEQLFNVKTVQVKTLEASQEQVNYGYITAQDSRKVDVYAWYSGFVDTLYADSIYKKVQKGELLAKVYSPEVFQAKQDYLNSINYNKDHNSPGMLQSAMIKLSLLGVSKKEIQKIEEERTVNEFTMIYAPISGWIFEKNINQGSSFNSNKKLFQIVNLDEVWAEIKLFQNELTRVDALQNFKVIPKNTNKIFKAQKSLLYPMMDPKEATTTLRLTVENEQGMLKPGMFVKAKASSAVKKRLIIPRTAAIRKNGIWYAFLATEFQGEYEPIEIKLAPLDTHYFEILEGLNSNDTVVNNALFMMDSDAQINGIY